MSGSIRIEAVIEALIVISVNFSKAAGKKLEAQSFVFLKVVPTCYREISNLTAISSIKERSKIGIE